MQVFESLTIGCILKCKALEILYPVMIAFIVVPTLYGRSDIRICCARVKEIYMVKVTNAVNRSYYLFSGKKNREVF